jgi:4-amino-4-deoxy-L-arabinose transferase-like glycosyltransferase
VTATLTPTDPPTATPPPASPARTGRERIALGVLLAGTAVLYLWNLGASGYANSFYAAAVRAGTRNWEALLFGSLDTGNTITVDKPPASLWVMALSGRIFGFDSWSMLVPEALMGVATVALVYAAVRRVSGPRAGLLAGLAMALTPVAVLMFRFNNPDALLVLLMVGAAYATVRALEKAGTRWLVLAGVLIGFAFLAKLGQALIVLPALALVYLITAPTGFWRRVRQLLLGGLAMVVSAGWYVALTEIWPADSRPYIGGSVGNSLLQLALGYNGLGRIFGSSDNPGGGGGFPRGGGGAASGFPGGGSGGGIGAALGGGEVGIGRMFSTEIGGQVAWLLPAALALLVAGLWTTRRAPRTDPTRASLILWGGWTLVTMVVFSFAEGIFHSYYTVALAPGIAGLVGVGGHELWRHRATWPGRATLTVVVAGTAAWAWVLLGRSATFLPWLRWVVVALAVIAVVALLVPVSGRQWAGAGLLAVVLAGVAGPAAYAVDTSITPHTGSIPTAGPATAGGRGGFPGGFPGGGAPGQGTPGDGRQRGAGGGRGIGEEAATDPALAALLQASTTKWSAATVGAMGGAELALSSDTDVMMIGGFMGSDPAPTLQQFQAYVAAGDVHYFVEGGGGFGGGPGGPPNADQLLEQVPQNVRDSPQFEQFLDQARRGGFPGGGGDSSTITEWVKANFASSTVGGRTVYDLTKHT